MLERILVAFVLVVFGIVVVILNIWYYRDLSKMTPEERTKEKEEIEEELKIW